MGTGIAVAGIWISIAVIIAMIKDDICPYGVVVLAGIACYATYYVAGIK